MPKISDYKTSEKWLERELTKRVKEAGGKALKFSSSIETGYPDRLVLMPGGKTYWAEMKSRNRKPTRIQELRHKELSRMGYTVVVIDREEQIDSFINLIHQQQ